MSRNSFEDLARWIAPNRGPILSPIPPETSHERLFSLHNRVKTPHSPAEKQALVFQDLSALPNRAARKALLLHQLRALTNELVRRPFHSYLFHMSKDRKSKPQLFDPLYAQGSVLDRCKRAIAEAQSTAHAERYTLELKQAESLQQNLGAILEQAPAVTHAALAEVAVGKKPANSSGKPERAPSQSEHCRHLEQLGWRQNTTALSPEQARQTGVPPTTSVYLGQKYFYIMPQSSVHDGEMSMYLLAQPAYIPTTDTWVVLQEQLFEKIPWETHSEALQRAKTALFTDQRPIDHPTTKTDEFAEKLDSLATASATPLSEAFIMSHCIALDSSFQLSSPRQTLLQLLGESSDALVAKHNELLLQHQALAASLAVHAEYLLDIQELDDSWEPNWSAQKAARLSQAMFNTLSSIFHTQPITSAQTKGWITEYQKLYGKASNRSKATELGDAFREVASNNAPHLLNSITSNIECFTMSANQLTLQQLGNSGLNQLSLNGDLLAKSMSHEEKTAFGEALADFLPLKFSNGETWYVPKEYFADYAQGSRVLGGVVVGPCDIPLAQDNLVLSEKTYLALQQQYLAAQEAALAENKDAVTHHVLDSLSNPKEKEEAQQLLKTIEKLLVITSLGLQQFISGEVLAYERLMHIPELLKYYHQLLLSRDPLSELRVLVLTLLSSGENTVKNV